MGDMTSATAIDLIDNLIGMIEDNQDNDYNEAFHMAIDALKAQAEKRTEERTETHACDCISRQEAVDAMDLGRWKGMTNEEAIKTLEANYPDACFGQLREAVDAAIEALKAQDATGDTISRQAAIDYVDDVPYIKEHPNIGLLWKAWLEQLPSAQPKKRTEERTETHELFGNSEQLPSAQPDIEKICARIKAEAIKRNVEYMKHGDRYMLGFVDGMRLARRIVDGTIDDPVYFTVSGE